MLSYGTRLVMWPRSQVILSALMSALLSKPNIIAGCLVGFLLIADEMQVKVGGVKSSQPTIVLMWCDENTQPGAVRWVVLSEGGAAELFPFAVLWSLTPGTDVKIYVKGGLTLLKDKSRMLGNISVWSRTPEMFSSQLMADLLQRKLKKLNLQSWNVSFIAPALFSE